MNNNNANITTTIVIQKFEKVFTQLSLRKINRTK